MTEDELTRKIISIGINFSDDTIISEFIDLNIAEQLPYWPYLNTEIKFKIFEKNMKDFENFMKSVSR